MLGYNGYNWRKSVYNLLLLSYLIQFGKFNDFFHLRSGPLALRGQAPGAPRAPPGAFPEQKKSRISLKLKINVFNGKEDMTIVENNYVFTQGGRVLGRLA